MSRSTKLVPVLLASATHLTEGAEVGPAQLEMTSDEPEPETGVIHNRYRAGWHRVSDARGELERGSTWGGIRASAA